MDHDDLSREIEPRNEQQLAAPETYHVKAQPEEEVHLRDYVHILLRRRWIMISFFLFVVVTVTVFTFAMRPLYTGTVTIKIDRADPNILTFKEMMETTSQDDKDYYQTQYSILKSRNLAARVIKRLSLDHDGDLIQDKEVRAAYRGVAEGDGLVMSALINAFLKRVEVNPEPDSQLVKVSFTDHDPVLARDAANAIAGAYTDYNVESKFQAGERARAWLQEQIEIMKARLEGSEQSLNKYTADNEILYIESRDNEKQSLIDGELESTSKFMASAVADRIDRQSRYLETKDGGNNPDVLDNLLVQNLKAQYSGLIGRYNSLLKTYKPNYPMMKRLKNEIASMEASIAKEEAEVRKGIKADYLASLEKESEITKVFNGEKKSAVDYQRKMVQYQILKREVDTNQELYQSLLQRMKEIGVSATMTSTNAQVLDRAELPRRPSSPNKRANLALALALGLFGGSGAAFFADYLDNTVKDTSEIERRMRLAPLGIIPYEKKIEKQQAALAIGENGKGALAEAFRSLGTFILFSCSPRPPKTILITSPGEHEGKTTVACNTVIALAKYLGKGIIIDADLRKAHVHKAFGVENGPGLSNYLSGNLEFQDEGFIRKTPVENLDMILAGPVPPDPSALLGSERMKELLNRLSGIYNFVIIDSAPMLGMADSIVLSSFVDGVIMVVMSGQTTRSALKETKRVFDYVNAKVLGVIMNGIRSGDMHYGYYSYYYGSSYYGGGDPEA
ncbi:MAG: polysaccharide biosynthesis tyrosine autokinase [Nitrospiraceae bacterium]|nr:polysaccharide biosynthesis tyrosine autokinase [Nitrospiraceae bacterium]